VKKKIYISGPISGKPDHNLPAFRAAEKMWQSRGYDVVVPHDIPAHDHEGTPCPPSYAEGGYGHSAACNLRADLVVLLTCDEVATLPGWDHSVGAKLEISVALHCGIPIRYMQEW
jgi:Domain of unknown function (DUF4406)